MLILKLAIFDLYIYTAKTSEPQRMKMYLLTWAPNEDSSQAAHPRSLIRLRCRQEGTLHHWLSKMCPVKILIRLRECAGWSESSLGAYAQRYVFWRFGSDSTVFYLICTLHLTSYNIYPKFRICLFECLSSDASKDWWLNGKQKYTDQKAPLRGVWNDQAFPFGAVWSVFSLLSETCLI